MLRVSFHVFRNILSGQCRIRFEDDSENTESCLSINLNATCLNISLIKNGDPQNSFDFFAPDGFFIPTSVSGVSTGTSFKCPEKFEAHFLNSIPTKSRIGKRVFESSFRFQITNTEVLQLTESKTHGKTSELHILNKRFMENLKNKLSEKRISQLHVKEILMLLIKPKTKYQIHCTSCDVPLGDIIYDDIKEHCNESFSEGWFCHQSDSLRVNDGLSSDCMYIDETSFLLPDFHLMQNLCSCGSSLCVEGSQPKGFVRVYFDKVFFRNPELPLNGKDFRKWVSLLTLWSLIEKSRTLSLFTKMLLQSKVSYYFTVVYVFSFFFIFMYSHDYFRNIYKAWAFTSKYVSRHFKRYF